MKKLRGAWPRCTTYPALYRAFRSAGAAKWDRGSVARFELNLEAELLQLRDELLDGSYQPGAYRQFTIRDRKPRVISAAPFRDRVVHHALMAELEPFLDARFYFHSYACRRGKGAHKAVDYYQHNARRYAYALKLDISRYFPSIRHNRLVAQLARYVGDLPLLATLEKIIRKVPTTEPGTGLPIGNLTSQIFANLYLNEIDHALAADRRCGAYLRYVDDLFLMGDDKAALWALRDDLEAALGELGLAVHPRKVALCPTRCKVDVLGYQVSRQRRWLRNDNGYRAQRRVRRMARRYAAGEMELAEVRQRLASWLGHTRHAQCEGLLKQLLGGARFARAPPVGEPVGA